MPTPRMDLLESRRLLAFVPTGASTINGVDFQSVDEIVNLPGGGYVAAGLFAEKTNFTRGVDIASRDDSDVFLQLVRGNKRSTLAIGSDSGNRLKFNDDRADFAALPRRVTDVDSPFGVSTIARRADEYVSQMKLGPDGRLYVALVFKRDLSLNTQNPRGRTLQPNDTFESEFFDSAILKYSISGNKFELQDVKQIGGPFNDVIQDFTFDDYGNLLVAGSFERRCDFDPSARNAIYDPEGRGDSFVAKYGRSGRLQWVSQFGGDTDDRAEIESAFSLTPGNADTIFVGGTFAEDALFARNGNGSDEPAARADDATDGYTMRLTGEGELIWVRAQGGSEFDGIRAVTAAPGSGVYSVGYFQEEADVNPVDDVEQIFRVNDDDRGGRDPATDLFFTRFDVNGEVVTVKQLSGTGYELLASASTGPSGDLVLAGSFYGELDIDPSRRVRTLTTPEADVDDANDDRDNAYAGFVASFTPEARLRNVTQVTGLEEQDVFINGASLGADGRLAIAGRYRGGFSISGSNVRVRTNTDFDDYREDGFSVVLDASLKPVT